MADKNQLILKKIIGHIEKIFSYVGDMDQANFLANTMVIEACAFNFLQIGELAGRLDEGFRKKRTDT